MYTFLIYYYITTIILLYTTVFLRNTASLQFIANFLYFFPDLDPLRQINLLTIARKHAHTWPISV